MGEVFTFRIGEEDSGRRVDDFLASRFGGLSRMRLANVVARGACRVNHVEAQSGNRLSAGDVVVIELEFSTATAMTPEPIPIEIIFEDDHIIVLVKPSGLLVHPTRQVKSGTLANALAYHLNRVQLDSTLRVEAESPNARSETGDSQPAVRPGIVHRLDKATSGLMVVAKTSRALTVLWRHFARRMVEKRYLALVHGEVGDSEGTIIAPIGRDENRRPRWGVLEGGKHAETRFHVVERMANGTLIELEPVTGRTNQLRIHCAHIGHPIVGDAERWGEGDAGIREDGVAASPCPRVSASRSS